MVQDFPRILLCSLVSIIKPVLHADLHLNTALIRRTNGLSLGTFKRAAVFLTSEGHCTEKPFEYVLLF